MTDVAKKERLIVTLMTVAGAVFIGAALFLLFLPTLRDVRGINDDIIDAQAELEAQYANRKNLLQVSDEVERIRKTTDDLRSQFIDPGQELVFITRIEEAAATNTVETSIRLFGAEKAKKGQPKLNDTFDISLVGGYPDVLTTLRTIEKLPNIVVIESLTVRAGDVPEIGQAAVVQMSVRGRIAFTPEDL